MDGENDLAINNKLFSFGGILGRRDFIINYFTINLMMMLVSTPLFYYLILDPSAISKLMVKTAGSYDAMAFYSALPPWLIALTFISWSITVLFYITNIPRRLSDIFAKEADSVSYIVAILFAAIAILSATQRSAVGLLVTIGLILLMAWKGEITGKLPKDPVKKFNWGAFFGTWIWGLINKSYKTLWVLLVIPTLAWFPFAVICGIKGNEWAYENKQWEDLDKFHKSQFNQSVFWVIFAPVWFFVLQIAIVILLGIGVTSYMKENPEAAKQFVSKMAASAETIIHSTFSDIKLSDKENKFYMDPLKWKNASEHDKMQLFKMATDYAEMKNAKRSANKKSDEMGKTKIYSNYNGEILCEFSFSQQDLAQFEQKKLGLKEIIQMTKVAKNAFKINENPAIP